MTQRKLQNTSRQFIITIPSNYVRVLNWEAKDIIEVEVDIQNRTLILYNKERRDLWIQKKKERQIKSDIEDKQEELERLEFIKKDY